MERVRSGQWQLVTSEAIEIELERMRNLEKRENILRLLELALVKFEIDGEIDLRSRSLLQVKRFEWVGLK